MRQRTYATRGSTNSFRFAQNDLCLTVPGCIARSSFAQSDQRRVADLRSWRGAAVDRRMPTIRTARGHSLGVDDDSTKPTRSAWGVVYRASFDLTHDLSPVPWRAGERIAAAPAPLSIGSPTDDHLARCIRHRIDECAVCTDGSRGLRPAQLSVLCSPLPTLHWCTNE